MTSLEKRSSISLAAIYGLRMLGLFLVLPVFALEAAHYPGGDDPSLVGLAMGIYGLTQGALQLAFGAASDKIGRKKVIVFGLLILAVGSFWAATADSLLGVLIGRALQGAGAVSGGNRFVGRPNTRSGQNQGHGFDWRQHWFDVRFVFDFGASPQRHRGFVGLVRANRPIGFWRCGCGHLGGASRACQ
jgi:hypothetical protein